MNNATEIEKMKFYLKFTGAANFAGVAQTHYTPLSEDQAAAIYQNASAAWWNQNVAIEVNGKMEGFDRSINACHASRLISVKVSTDALHR